MATPTYEQFIEPEPRFKLAKLMIDHEVGVSICIVKIPKFDSDYFED